MSVSCWLLIVCSIFTLCSAKNETRRVNPELIDLLLSESSSQLRKLKNAREAILNSAWAFPKIAITKNAKNIMWHILKANKSLSEHSVEDLKPLSALIADVSDYDLNMIDVTKIEIIQFLGKVRDFSKIQATIVLNSIKTKWKGKFSLKKGANINKLGGLICGLNNEEIENIVPAEFRKIESKVFDNLYACTDDQMKILVKKVTRTTGFGPPQSWTSKDTRNIGMIVASLNKSQLRQMRPAAMSGVSDAAMLKMDLKLLQSMLKSQAKKLSVTAKKIYLDRVGLIIFSSAPSPRGFLAVGALSTAVFCAWKLIETSALS